MRFIQYFLLIFFCMLGSVFAAATKEEDDFVYFLTLADIHFDPFIYCRAHSRPCPIIEKLRQTPVNGWAAIFDTYGKQVSRYREDTNYPLLTSSLKAAQNIANKHEAKFVLVLGDLLGHEYYVDYKQFSNDKTRAGYHDFVKKTMAFLTLEFKQAFPNTSVYMVVGNNDSYQGDYFSEPDGAFFNDMGFLFSSLLKPADPSFQTSFSFAGYYSLPLPAKNLRLIVLNSNLFSNKAKGKRAAYAADKQLVWFSAELAKAKARQEKVLIAMHIPLGIDIFQTLKSRLFRLVALWKPLYSARFQEEIERYAPEIAGIFTGHLHADSFRLITQGPNEVPTTGVPSISPIFGSNPGFKIYAYAPLEKELVNSVTYYSILSEEKVWGLEYHFNRVYHPDCYACPQISKENSSASEINWFPIYWCPLHKITKKEAKICLT